MHYPGGSLADFLRTRIQQLSEMNLHKITLDVANGLEYLHQRNLVHNGLSTNTVFVANLSEVMYSFANAVDCARKCVAILNLSHSWSPCSIVHFST